MRPVMIGWILGEEENHDGDHDHGNAPLIPSWTGVVNEDITLVGTGDINEVQVEPELVTRSKNNDEGESMERKVTNYVAKISGTYGDYMKMLWGKQRENGLQLLDDDCSNYNIGVLFL